MASNTKTEASATPPISPLTIIQPNGTEYVALGPALRAELIEVRAYPGSV